MPLFLGSKFSIKTLANLLNTDVADLLESLLAAINEGYIIPDSYNYQSFLISSAQVESDIEFRFVHDRIREAFYAQIKESQLPAVHLKIAKTLEKEATDLQEGNILFDIANHYTLGTALLTKPDERLKLAELFFQAGKKAVEGAAFGSAVSYFRDGIKLLPPGSWQSHYELTHALHETACEAARSVSLEAEIYEFGDPILAHAKDAVV